MVVRLTAQCSAHGYASATATLQVWDEIWLLLHLGSWLVCWVIGPASALLGLSRLWSLGVAVLVAVVPPMVHRRITTWLGAPRLRVLRPERPLRSRLRLELIRYYRLTARTPGR